MTSSVYIRNIGALDYSVKRTDENDYKTEFVAKVSFRNAGKTLFGDTPWWQEIEFGKPESLDELIMALTYIKAMHTDQFKFDHEGLAHAIRRCDNECKAKRDEDGWKCEWCGEVTKGKYADDGKPKRCSECGAFFDEYEEGGDD